MGTACGTHGSEQKFWLGSFKEDYCLEEQRYRREDNIKIDLKGRGRGERGPVSSVCKTRTTLPEHIYMPLYCSLFNLQFVLWAELNPLRIRRTEVTYRKQYSTFVSGLSRLLYPVMLSLFVLKRLWQVGERCLRRRCK